MMNLRQGFPTPQPNVVLNGDSWIPLTPQKSVPPGSNLAPAEIQGNPLVRSNWQELVGIYSGLLQEKTNNNGGLQNFIPTGLTDATFVEQNYHNAAVVQNNRSIHLGAGSYGRNLANGGGSVCYRNSSPQLLSTNAAYPPSWNGTPERCSYISNAYAPSPNKALDKFSYISNTPSLSGSSEKYGYTSNKPLISLADPQLEGSLSGYRPAGSTFPKLDDKFSSTQRPSGRKVSEAPTEEFPVPYWPLYNLNSPPRPEGVLASKVTFEFAPETPDQGKQLKSQQLSDLRNPLIDGISSWEKHKNDNLISEQQENIESFCNELQPNIVDSSSGIITVPAKENQISIDEGQGGIDLNKTPKQKTEKRRKHRPKVVREGKSKRTPKGNTTKNTTSSEKPAEKRKYVRKKGLQVSTPQQENKANEAEVPDVQSATKSCRRMLNFDLEEAEQKSQVTTNHNQAEKHEGCKELFNLNLEFQDPECCIGINRANNPSSALQRENHHGLYALEPHHISTSTLTHPTNQIPGRVSTSLIPSAASATANNRTLNVIARNLSMRNANLYQTNSQNGYSHRNQDILGESIGHLVFQPNSTLSNLEKTRQHLLQITQDQEDVTGASIKRGWKRAFSHTAVPSLNETDIWLGSQLLQHKRANEGERYVVSSNVGIGASESYKKKKVSDLFDGTGTCLPSCISQTQYCSRQMETRVTDGVHASNCTPQSKVITPDYYIEKDSTFKKLATTGNLTHENQHTNHMVVRHDTMKQHSPSQVHVHKERMGNQTSQPHSEVPIHNALVAVASRNLLSPTYKTSRSIQEHEMGNSHVKMSRKRQTQRPGTLKQALNGDKLIHKNQNPSAKTTGAGTLGKEMYLQLFNEIINQLKGLCIKDNSEETVGKEQNALVLYKGDRSIVPYDGLDFIKRRRPRPKVDLDPETNRLWNLLMGKEGSESTETMDKHTEQWWEDERKVFRGRVDSFIARMHLVQGDRRFSPWKGSVVDSVIGVFLTQNVSDHLSSSAFMSLAAKFSLCSTKEDFCQAEVNQVIGEPQVQIIDLDGAVTYPAQTLWQPVFYHSSVTSSETSEPRVEDLLTGTRSSSGMKSKRTEEETISSQNSSESFIYQALEEAKSSSESNSDVEDQIMASNSHKNQNPEELFLQPGRNSLFPEYQNYVLGNSFLGNTPELTNQQSENLKHYGKNSRLDRGCDTYNASSFSMLQFQESSPSRNVQLDMRQDLGVQQTNFFGLSAKADMPSLPVMTSDINRPEGIDNLRGYIGRRARYASSATVQVPEMSQIQSSRATEPTSLVYNQVFQPSQVNHPEPTSPLKPSTDDGFSMQSIKTNQENSFKTIQPQSISITERTRLTEALPKTQSGTTSNKPLRKTGADMSNVRKRKLDREKAKTFNWDNLRKQAESVGCSKERSKDVTDSLDYEALREADVKVISETIRDRGMNNMLAERIKDFLNRLVREHGSTDLEWLRDVPPDKAKDYLLSIRGLGLKSVECVRLLTLHHVAFPVDTNVGRIAVRLGWVPLQPLPESLQLHLLELYPVLESIQKYLWPRLCKLDQRTLYELHYQMITFGKVFCTKSKPNCNACPMRGECRHFASAFASARLALPGPEERSIVSSTAPVAADKVSPLSFSPMPLPPPDNNIARETSFAWRSNEPTVEEPMTPEPSIEVTESDIEDAFYDDSDEIPTIKLNIEEFTTNLQTFMQGHMEMQERDLSKAIVALNPEIASIPTRKLKNVDRLRTEHQVYELPDLHPLLRGLDRREPDDPSPYLLAIWTPGETANSIQPPESKCDYQGQGVLCNEKTCFKCNSTRETNAQTVRGTILIPCRTAMRGSFPLNGTYFQVNEMFADHESSLNPIEVPRSLIWNLPRRTVYFGTSVSNIFKGLTTEEIQFCFWRGFVCVRGFDQKMRTPRPLMARLHFPASKLTKAKNEENKGQARIQKQ